MYFTGHGVMAYSYSGALYETMLNIAGEMGLYVNRTLCPVSLFSGSTLFLTCRSLAGAILYRDHYLTHGFNKRK